jgi:fatty acid desaturase
MAETAVVPLWPMYHLGGMIFASLGAVAKGWHEGLQLARMSDDKNGDSDLAKEASASKAVEKDETNKPIPKPPPALLKRDPIAFPTVGLLVLALGTWVGVFLAFVVNVGGGGGGGDGPSSLLESRPLVAVGLNTAAVYLAFTVAHDASHGSVAPRYPKLNAFLGQLACLPLLAPFAIVKQVRKVFL